MPLPLLNNRTLTIGQRSCSSRVEHIAHSIHCLAERVVECAREIVEISQIESRLNGIVIGACAIVPQKHVSVEAIYISCGTKSRRSCTIETACGVGAWRQIGWNQIA